MTLTQMPARSIVRSIAHAAERWTDADYPPRVRVLDRIAERTGYCIPAVEFALDRLFESITEDAIVATIEDELGSLETLDRFVPRKGRPDAHAAPLGDVCIISSRTTIGVAVPPAIFALCAKCNVLVKDREDSLVTSFFETLYQEDDVFYSAAKAQVWESSHENSRELQGFDAVVVFGTAETLASVRNALRPEARFIGFGPRISAGYVAREALGDPGGARELARLAARDIVLYETEGCLSLHLLFVESGGAVGVDEFSTILDAQIERAGVEFPRARAAASNAARAAQTLLMERFRGNSLVSVTPRHADVIAVDQPDEAADYLRRHAIQLEGLAVAAQRDDLLQLATGAGAVRITNFGELQSPPLQGHHGGRARIADFIRWIDKAP
ncbi:MAG TPA: acyl-CoA reductase [Candidatus Rubrimentiphilum sp.]|nr:acyl-CoA reductase [Candidatus Rubrimentiphilum sp.]